MNHSFPSLSVSRSRLNLTLAVRDIFEGLTRWPLWAMIGWQDIKQRYRRSVLGPFWLSLSTGIMVGALGLLYSSLLGIPLAEYLPFLTLGLLAWGLISTVVTEGCSSFIVSESFIKQVKLPYSTHVYRVIWRNVIIFIHNLVVYIPVAVIFGVWPGPALFVVLPALMLIALNAVWVVMLLGLVCARFRDLPQIVTSLMQVVFFITPILWKPEILPRQRFFIVTYNPVYHFVELVRGPLMGQLPSESSWIAAGLVTLAGWSVTFSVYVRFRSRIPYWV